MSMESHDNDLVSVKVGESTIPPINYCMVGEDLYRSGVPNELNFSFLKTLKLRTIVFVGPENLPRELVCFCKEQGIGIEEVASEDHKSQWQPMSEETVKSALEKILDTTKYPLMLMCNLGRHRTGTVIACLRKLQKWNLTSVLEEYRRYAGPKVRIFNEQFIELFDTDSVHIPPHPPKWL